MAVNPNTDGVGTPALSQSLYATSPHNYTVQGSIGGGLAPGGGGTFDVSCVKCHNSPQTDNERQDGTNQFQLHMSPNRRLLTEFGITGNPDPIGSNFCLRCHSQSRALIWR